MDKEINIIKEQLLQKLQRYADENNLQLNPDKETLQSLLEALARRKIKKGFFYCPCRLITGDPDKDKEIICPCIFHKQEIVSSGVCHCGLFMKGKS